MLLAQSDTLGTEKKSENSEIYQKILLQKQWETTTNF
jgi:hypothetical protein